MNCAHCGTSLSTIDIIEDGRFCSNEHRAAYVVGGSEAPLCDLVEAPVFAVGEFATAHFQGDPLSVDFPLQVEMPGCYNYGCTDSQPGGPVYEPCPIAVEPVWQSPSGAMPFLTSVVLPKSVIVSASLLVQPLPNQNGFLGLWNTWSPLRRWALFIIPVMVAAGTNFIVGRTTAAPAAEPPVAKVVVEDFKSGLERWQGAEAHAKPWKWESSQGATPQSLAVFKPALGIADYKLEFTADAIKNSVSWAARVKDLQNYQAFQISSRKSGAESQFSFSRYKVTAGREGPRTLVPLHIITPAGNVWRVTVESVGDSRSLWINDQIANAWTDTEEDTGGIGFFAGKADQFVLKTVKVSEQLTYTASR